MQKILITGSNGFVARNLITALTRQEELAVLTFDHSQSLEQLAHDLAQADFVFHLAGVNRPQDVDEFDRGNRGLTEYLIAELIKNGRAVPIVYSSSTQAEHDNPYGRSKLAAERALEDYGANMKVSVFPLRLPNLFGKWARPNYNSVVATYCHNVAHDLPLTISDRQNKLELAYIDDVVELFLTILKTNELTSEPILPISETTLGELADTICSFRDQRTSALIPRMSEKLTRELYTTYLSYLERDDFVYNLQVNEDERGTLVELFKSVGFGQVFVSCTYPGVTRGNHYHDSKVEKFCVVHGSAKIAFRHIGEDDSFSFEVDGKQMQIIDIPPGYTHSITNIGDDEMLVLFWANEVFDPSRPDTYYCEV